ncbi:BrnT family toxin [Candidatus Amarolinea dominans]|uniref:BrnT family toxin n=1 Tax=Candidatus Amarolinea dominans TaxID=3140696 RepID=UPI0031CC4974
MNIEEKLEAKHGVTDREARQVLLGRSRIRFAEKGHTDGENVYVSFGHTMGGRYLAVFFIYKPTSQTAVIISAREMSERERRTYGRK